MKYNMTQNIKEHVGNKYLRKITSAVDNTTTIEVDVYCVLEAFNVTCPALSHGLKKLLCAGLRGKGDKVQDLTETLAAINRAIELEKGRTHSKPPILENSVYNPVKYENSEFPKASKFPKEMKCIDNKDAIGLTVGEIYTIEKYSGNSLNDYWLKNDNDEFHWYLSNRFEEVTQKPKLKVTCVCDKLCGTSYLKTYEVEKNFPAQYEIINDFGASVALPKDHFVPCK